MNNTIWEQRLMAIKSISPEVCLRMREPGNWYCHVPGVHVKKPSVIEGLSPTGRTTPEEAVHHTFTQLTDLLKPEYFLILASGRRVRWDGFMWQDVPMPEEG